MPINTALCMDSNHTKRNFVGRGSFNEPHKLCYYLLNCKLLHDIVFHKRMDTLNPEVSC